jgi:hypothetical protein
MKLIIAGIVGRLGSLLLAGAAANAATLPANSAEPSVWVSTNDPTHGGAD